MRSNNSPNWGRRACALLSISALTIVLNIGYAAEPANDAAVKAAVQAAFNADKGLFAQHIDVSVHDGEVHLAGFVQKPEDVERAKKDAAGVAGVKKVKNEITVKLNDESKTSG